MAEQLKHIARSRAFLWSKVQGVGAGWDRFWFQPIDSFNTCVIRILCGSMLLYTHLIWGTRLDEFFTNDGWNSSLVVQQMQRDTLAWSFWWYVPETSMVAVHWACNAILLAFVLGLFTRVTSVLAWGIAVGYAHRATISNYGLDQITCILALYLAVAPCGQYLSLDAWWRSRRQSQLDPPPSILANVSMRLMQVHLCIIYLWAGLGKLQGESWWDGGAMWQAICNFEYQSFDLTFLAAFPVVLNLLTHLTIAWEVFFCALIWNRTLRPLMLFLGLGMHFGIGAFLGMWTFGTAMTFGYLAFVKPEQVRRVVATILGRPSLRQPRWLSLSEASQTMGTTEKTVAIAEADAEATEKEATEEEANEEVVEKYPLPGMVLVNSVKSGEGILAGKVVQPLKAFVEEQPSIILLAKSESHRLKIQAYLGRYLHNVLVTNCFAKAAKVCSALAEPVVVDVNSMMTEAELQMIMQMIRSHNSQSRFVWVGPSPLFAVDDPGSIVIEKNCSLKQIRTAIEEVSGCTFRRESHSEPVAVQASNSGTSLLSIVFLLLAFGLVGCSNTQSPVMMLERARLCVDRGQTDEAQSILDEMLAMDPNDAEAYYLRGVAYEQQANLEKAKQAYDDCLKRQPDNQAALNNRGVVQGQLGKSELAIADLERAIEVNPRDALAWSNLGLAQHLLHRHEDALTSYAKAIEIQPEIRYVFQRGNVMLDAERFGEAEAEFTKVLDLDVRYAAAYLNRANARVSLGLWQPAREDLKMAEANDQELTLAPHIKSLQRTIDDELWEFVQTEEISKWLTANQWEVLTAPAPFRVAARRAGGESQNVVILQRNQEGQCICDQAIVESAIESTSPLLLLIVEEVRESDVPYELGKLPSWLAHYAETWRPSAEDFVPSSSRLLNPSISAQSTEAATRR